MNIENLKALVYGKETTPYQRALALSEFSKVVELIKEMEAINTVVAEVEKTLPTDEEIVNEANEIGEKESWPIGRQTGFIFGAKWIRNLMRKEATV